MVGRDNSWVSRVWAGKAIPDRNQLAAWLELCEVSEEQAGEAWRLFEPAHTETETWRSKMRDGHVQHEGRERLDRARRVLAFEPWIVPGPLQTEATAREILSGPDAAPGTDVEVAVIERLAMNGAALESGRQFDFLLAEGLVARLSGDRPQFAKLRQLDAEPNVRIRVLPAGNGTEHPGVGFTVYEDGDGERTVVVELPHGQVEVTGPDEVDIYGQRWSEMWSSSRQLARN